MQDSFSFATLEWSMTECLLLDHIEWDNKTKLWKAVGIQKIAYASSQANNPFEAITLLINNNKFLDAFSVTSPSHMAKITPETTLDKVISLFLKTMTDEILLRACFHVLRSLRYIKEKNQWEIAGQGLNTNIYIEHNSLSMCFGSLWAKIKHIEIIKEDEKYVYLKNYFPSLGEPFTDESGLQTKIPWETFSSAHFSRQVT